MTAFKVTSGGDYDPMNSVDIDLVVVGLASLFMDGSTDAYVDGADLETPIYSDGGVDGYSSLSGETFDTAGFLFDYSGSTFRAFFRGGSFGDVLVGGNGADELDGHAGSDVLTGNGGADKLDGGAGADTMIGGAGDDEYYIDDPGDRVVETGPADDVDRFYSSIDYKMPTRGENLNLKGAAFSGIGNAERNWMSGNKIGNLLEGRDGRDVVDGQRGDDSIWGGGGDDVLVGGSGDDWLYGGQGNDRIRGGRGKDHIFCDLGDDTIFFKDGGIGTSRKDADVIVDLNGRSGDRLNFYMVDFKEGNKFIDYFSFIGEKKFSGDSGEMRLSNEKDASWLLADTDGDKSADLFIRLEDSVHVIDALL